MEVADRKERKEGWGDGRYVRPSTERPILVMRSLIASMPIASKVKFDLTHAQDVLKPAVELV